MEYWNSKIYNKVIHENFHLPLDAPKERQSTLSPDIFFIFFLSFLTAVIFITASSLLTPRLQNHEMCGIPTGGQEECYFNCTLVTCAPVFSTLVEDLSCLEDCFPKKDNCASMLLNDVLTKGVCNITTSLGLDFGPAIYPVSNDCEFLDPFIESGITKGTCSDKTEALLMTSSECLEVILEQPNVILNTLIQLIVSSCRTNVAIGIIIFLVQNGLGNTRKYTINSKTIGNITFPRTRLAPTQIIVENPNTRTKLQFENTKHRYPWVCSLRSTGPSPVHRCAVNLLSIPPGPTVVVGAAHCTYLCKDGTREVPVCCCSDGTDDCRESNPKCGDDPGVVEMTGKDSFVLCGEWDSSQAGSDISAERYNVKLPILEIIRHPDFDPQKGPINGNDVVVFKIDDTAIQNNVANSLQLWPACLPSKRNEWPLTGIHTGWSEPPPFSFIQSQAPGFTRIYNDFYKQWHYKMDILDICEDPKDSALCGGPLKFPSNSSYPAGTVCAKDFTRQSCFSTGDSGSPLLVKSNEDRFYIEGILSFVKGCDQFQFGAANSNKNTWILTQQTFNPSTYTKLSCFLPWIAEQYNMKYDYTSSLDQACNIGTGDPQDGEKPCRNTHSNEDEVLSKHEIDCKFPYYYNGKIYDECILLAEGDFLYPVFRCPIRNITTKIDGINSFQFSSLVEGFCLSNFTDSLSTLDPAKSCDEKDKRLPFSQCKNNCPGVRAFGIVGGGAVLAGVATLGALTPLGGVAGVAGVATLGTLGAGGALMLAQSNCAAPLFCIANAKCCLVVPSINGLVCPDTCV